MPSEAAVLTCATIGNCGPGFDVISLAVADAGDRITMRRADEDSITMLGPGSDAVPMDWTRNIAGVVVEALRAAGGPADPVHITVEKPRAAGSGLGSSAASASGTAMAYARLFGAMGPDEFLAAADAGEALAGGGNGDDIAAVLYGGLVIAHPDGPVQRVQPPADLHLGIVVPEVVLETQKMRDLLPIQWPRDATARNMARLASLVDACHRDDVAGFGAALDDGLAVPFRKSHWPWFDQARAAAREAGAAGAAVCGSGPAMFAVAEDRSTAIQAAAAMQEAVESSGHAAQHFPARPEYEVPYVRMR